MQDLRGLVAGSSIMTIYIRGEMIEIPHHSIEFLLEGFIKTQGTQELITLPAALLPSHANQSFQNLDITAIKGARFSHQAPCYLVETRARVIFFDIAALESESRLQRKSSSFVPHSGDNPHRPLSREHGGNMSWPEHFYKKRHHKQNVEGIGRHANSLSAKAMHLSIYGSTVNIRRHIQSYPGSNLVKPLHSVSYPTMPLDQGRPLVSVRKERYATVRKNLEGKNFTGEIISKPLQSTASKENRVPKDSSDDFGADEFIVRIDLPSRLSFRQDSIKWHPYF
ncbi:hypothetical protein TorRG33x02_275380 [Trema orientale]|uniref:Uncharacterized protein n=1 Tax=Trema orientale TaxID=63057 RepID=A0A2P5CRZ3_TREOI|nr:hypothetical protein TorRG33x02_275380 [Trema orientale]